MGSKENGKTPEASLKSALVYVKDISDGKACFLITLVGRSVTISYPLCNLPEALQGIRKCTFLHADVDYSEQDVENFELHNLRRTSDYCPKEEKKPVEQIVLTNGRIWSIDNLEALIEARRKFNSTTY